LTSFATPVSPTKNRSIWEFSNRLQRLAIAGRRTLICERQVINQEMTPEQAGQHIQCIHEKNAYLK
jgi:hypothetical protein